MVVSCSGCGSDIELDPEDCGNAVFRCQICGWKIPTYTETYFKESGMKCLPFLLPKLHIGAVVKIINEEHVWRNDIGIVVDKKFKFYRIELNGVRTWIPEHWVEALNEHT